MAKNKLSAPIQREIDRQKILEILSSSDEFGFLFSAHFKDERDLEEEERKWKEDIQKLKEILDEYQRLNEGKPAKSSRSSKLSKPSKVQ